MMMMFGSGSCSVCIVTNNSTTLYGNAWNLLTKDPCRMCIFNSLLTFYYINNIEIQYSLVNVCVSYSIYMVDAHKAILVYKYNIYSTSFY